VPACSQTIIAQGELADSIHLIAAGQVELVAEGPPSAPPAPLLSGLAMDMGDPQDHDMFDAAVPELGSSPSGLTSAMLSGDVLNGVGGSPTRRGRPGSAPSNRSSSESCSGRVIAVKGPGDSLGLPHGLQAALASSTGGGGGSSCSSGSNQALPAEGEVRWQVCARARGAVTVFRVRCADLGALVAAHPEMEGAVRQMLVQQETDMMVAEAMRQLRLFNEAGAHQHPVAAGGGMGL
jgi:CRP-like cAMP-binding protein